MDAAKTTPATSIPVGSAGPLRVHARGVVSDVAPERSNRPLLKDDAFQQAEEVATYVITPYRHADCNLRTQLKRILRRAGLEPWPRLFRNLRSSRETELASTYPLHVAAYWIGNTARIAERHYLQIPQEVYEQAAQNPAHGECGAQSEAQRSFAVNRSDSGQTPEKSPENAAALAGANDRKSLQGKGMETKGIEPSFRRCDRRVLPLHHVPRNEPDRILRPFSRESTPIQILWQK
jgi:hypothetical protein